MASISVSSAGPVGLRDESTVPNGGLETISATNDFHTINMGHESSSDQLSNFPVAETQLQIPTPNLLQCPFWLGNAATSGLTIMMRLEAASPLSLRQNEQPQSTSGDDHFYTIQLKLVPAVAEEPGDVPQPFQPLAQIGNGVHENSANLGKTIVSLTFQAGLALAVLYFSNPSPAQQSHTTWSHLPLVEVAMVIGFASSLTGILLRRNYNVLGKCLEKVGYLSTALGFFVMMSMFLPQKVVFVCWVASAVSLLAFVLALLKPNQA